MEQVLERMERKLENIGTEQVRMREDIARIKGKLEGRIDTRTTIIAWAGVVFGIAALLLKLFRTDAIRWYVRGFCWGVSSRNRTYPVRSDIISRFCVSTTIYIFRRKILKQKIIFGALFLALISVTTICSAQDLVLHLSFDELAGDVVKDLSEFGNDATFNKGNPKLIDGVFGKAMEFDGKTAAEIDDSPSLDIVDAITIEFWALVKGGEAIQSGVEKGAAWVSGLYNLAALYNGGTILQFFDLPEPCNDDNIGPSIQDGEWHFLAGTWDGDDIKLYIDGELEAEMPCKGKLSPNDAPLFIGARGASQRFLTGALDEIKVYNYALTKDELLQDMETPVPSSVDAQNKLATFWGHLKTD